MAALLSLPVVLSMSTTSEAARWEWIGDAGDNKHYIDTESISGGPDGFKRAWTKVESATPDCTSEFAIGQDKCVSYFLTYDRYYHNRSKCMTQSQWYFTDGTTVGFKHQCERERVIPGSIGEIAWKYLFQ